MIADDKEKLRKRAKIQRAMVRKPDEKSVELIRHFPAAEFRGCRFAGFWPLGDEIDLRPLMLALDARGEQLCFPITGAQGEALSFKTWTPQTVMQEGRFKTMEPDAKQESITPNFIFVPLLAFDLSGGRLGYGGGYYDRTLSRLALQDEIIACGVGFDAQQRAHVPMGPHDVRLDAILTPSGFKWFE